MVTSVPSTVVTIAPSVRSTGPRESLGSALHVGGRASVPDPELPGFLQVFDATRTRPSALRSSCSQRERARTSASVSMVETEGLEPVQDAHAPRKPLGVEEPRAAATDQDIHVRT